MIFTGRNSKLEIDQFNESNPHKKMKIESQYGFSFMTGRDLTPEEILLILPSSHTFEKQEVDIISLTKLQNFGSFTEKETLFFLKMCQTVDLQEKEIFLCLLSLIKEDRRKKKKAIKKLSSLNNYNMVLEKIILLLISQDLDFKCKCNLLKVVEALYIKHKLDILYWIEILYLLTKLLDDDMLRNQSLDILSHFFIYDIERITGLILQEINIEPNQDIISKLLALFVIYNGYKNTLRLFTEGDSNYGFASNILGFLKSHYYISTFVNVEIVDFRDEMFHFLKKVLKYRNKKIRKEIANIIAHLCFEGLVSDEECTSWFKNFMIIILEYCNVQVSNSDLFNTDMRDFIIPSVDQEKTYLMHLLRTCSIVSINNQNSSHFTFEILKKWPDFTLNNIKIIYRIFENLDYSCVVSYLVNNFENMIDSKFEEYKNMVISIFTGILPSKEIEEILISEMLQKDLILEIFNKTDSLVIENRDTYLDNIFLLLKSNSILCANNILHLATLGGCKRREWYKIFEISKGKIDDIQDDTKFIGYKIINKILEKIDKPDLKNFGIFLYEKLNKNNIILLGRQLTTLSKIYSVVPFQNSTDLILEMAPLLKFKDDFIKEKTIVLISEILKNKKENSIKKIEFMRISYDVMDYLSYWYIKKKQCGIGLLIQISEYVPPQELINIFLEFLEVNNKNVKKGIILGISQLSNHVGIYNVLPVLLVDYGHVEDKVKLIIIRTLIKCKMSKRYIPYLNTVIDDAVLNPDLEFRMSGIELCTELLININKSEMDTEIFVHFLNLLWFNLLDKNVLIRKIFNRFIEVFTKTFGSQVLIKYVIQGLYHPAKNIRKRYFEIYDIMKKYDLNINEYISILNEELQ